MISLQIDNSRELTLLSKIPLFFGFGQSDQIVRHLEIVLN